MSKRLTKNRRTRRRSIRKSRRGSRRKSRRGSRRKSRRGSRRKSRRRSRRGARFGMIPASDYKIRRDHKKITGYLADACQECDNEWEVHSKLNGVQFKPERMEWMKELCTDCAKIVCGNYFRLKKLGLPNLENERKECDSKMRRVERLR